jgi:hypothetical protein
VNAARVHSVSFHCDEDALSGAAFSRGLADLTNQDAARVPGGFLNNPKVKIPLPPALEEAANIE